MRINCHAHTFNLRSVFSEETLRRNPPPWLLNAVPASLILHRNLPNPFDPTAAIYCEPPLFYISAICACPETPRVA